MSCCCWAGACSSTFTGQEHELQASRPVLLPDSLAVQVSTCSVVVEHAASTYEYHQE